MSDQSAERCAHIKLGRIDADLNRFRCFGCGEIFDFVEQPAASPAQLSAREWLSAYLKEKTKDGKDWWDHDLPAMLEAYRDASQRQPSEPSSWEGGPIWVVRGDHAQEACFNRETAERRVAERKHPENWRIVKYVVERQPQSVSEEQKSGFICAKWKKLSDGCVARCDKDHGHDGDHVDSVILIGWSEAFKEEL